MHDCNAVMRMVMMALDGELPEDKEKQFLAEVNRCPHCLERYDIEKSFKHFLSNKIETKHTSAQSIEDIKAKIRNIKPE